MPREATALRILPIGDGMLTPGQAAEWCENDSDGYFTLLAVGCEHCRNELAADSLAVLASDLGDMVQACGRALATGQPARLKRQFAEAAAAGDFKDCTHQLTALLAHAHPEGWDGDSPVFDAIHALQVELEARIRKGAA